MDITKRTFLFVATLSLVAACATPYQESGFTGGVTASPLSESIFEIRAEGNAFIGAGQIQDYALLKGAEICMRGSFTHFIPLSQTDLTQSGVIQDNNYNTNCYGDSCWTTGGGFTSFSKPGTSMRIKLFGVNDKIPPTAFSCSVIYNSLAPKYMK